MKKSKLKKLIKEIIEEEDINEIKLSPSDTLINKITYGELITYLVKNNNGKEVNEKDIYNGLINCVKNKFDKKKSFIKKNVDLINDYIKSY